MFTRYRIIRIPCAHYTASQSFYQLHTIDLARRAAGTLLHYDGRVQKEGDTSDFMMQIDTLTPIVSTCDLSNFTLACMTYYSPFIC